MTKSINRRKEQNSISMDLDTGKQYLFLSLCGIYIFVA